MPDLDAGRRPEELTRPAAGDVPAERDAAFSWGSGLRLSWRLTAEGRSGHLVTFLDSDGKTEDAVLDALPYDLRRAEARTGAVGLRPDAKRYRDPRQAYQAVGLLYEDESGDPPLIRLSALGSAVRRWLPVLNDKNAPILGRHAAYALAACQLRNPTSITGRSFDASVEVFPFAFIWRAMLALGNKIDSDELNRAIFRVRSEGELEEAINSIRRYRVERDPDVLGEETITDPRAKNDRIIPWMAGASFGWLLIGDKRGGGETGYYEIPPRMVPVLAEASAIRHKSRSFDSIPDYVRHVARAAGLPKDLR